MSPSPWRSPPDSNLQMHRDRPASRQVELLHSISLCSPRSVAERDLMNRPTDEAAWILDQALVWIASRRTSDGSWQEYRSARPAEAERLDQIERNFLAYLPTPRLVGLGGPFPDTEETTAARWIDRRRMEGSHFRRTDGKTCLVYGDGETRPCMFVPSAIISAFPGWNCVSPPPSEAFVPYSLAFRWLAQLLSIRDGLAIDLVDDEAQRLLAQWGRSGSLIWYGASSTGDDPLSDYQIIDEEPWERRYGHIPSVEHRFRTSQLAALSPYVQLSSTFLGAANSSETQNLATDSAATYHSGRPGRPTSINLVLKEAKRRLEAGRPITKKIEFARELADWLAHEHEDAPSMKADSIRDDRKFTSLFNKTKEARRIADLGASNKADQKPV